MEEERQSYDTMWTCVLAVRDTDEEYGFLLKSLPSAFRLRPTEIIVGVDSIDGKVSERIVSRVKELQQKHGYENLKILAVEKSSDWSFQLAKIMWYAYSTAQHDKILSFDVDSILTQHVMKGLDQIGKDKVAILSFTKRLRISNAAELIRYIFYRLRVRTSDYVFSGIYWIWRPYFFDIVEEDRYRQIRNGIDTFLTEECIKQGKYKIMTRKEIGIKALTPQNGDLPWRQYQVGVWLAAHKNDWTITREQRRLERWNTSDHQRPQTLASKVVHYKLWDLDKHLSFFVWLKAFAYQHPYLLKGYRWANAHPDHEILKKAQSLNQEEWEYLGSELFSHMDWNKKGTGFVEK
jgi:hypothetical protein